MKAKTLILLLLAVSCGLGAVVLTKNWLDKQQTTPAVQQDNVITLVARRHLHLGEYIKDPKEMFIEKSVQSSAMPPLAVASFDDLKDCSMKMSLTEGGYLTREHLQPKDQASLQGQLEKGQQAVAIKVDPRIMAGGFVTPRSRVDVILTVRGQYTKTILQNMLVLAVDMQHNPEKRDPTLGSTVTLAVTKDQGDLLAMAESAGELRLSLRGDGDDKPRDTRGVTIEDLRNAGKSQHSSSADHDNAKSSPIPVAVAPQPVPVAPPPAKKAEPKAERVVKSTPAPVEKEQRTHKLRIEDPGNVITYEINLDDPSAPAKSSTGKKSSADKKGGTDDSSKADQR